MIDTTMVQIPTEGVDVARGYGNSGVSVLALQNMGETPIWMGEVGKGWSLQPGETFPRQLDLESQEPLVLSSVGDGGLARMVLRYNSLSI